MANVLAYHRPTTIAAALALLDRSVPTVVVGGGTQVVPTLHGEPVEVVDLQSLGLAGITADHEVGRVGATTTLDAVMSSNLPAAIREAARREAPSTLRTLATIGGVVAGRDPESELLAVLLVHEAIVHLEGTTDSRSVPLSELLATGLQRTELITGIELQTAGTSLSERTVRTGMDTPIVAVAGRSHSGTTLLAATGVAAVPTLFADPAALTPPEDFRGSSAYRKHLAVTLTERVRNALASSAN